MTLATSDLALYAFAVFVLFATPGPVWVGLIARGLSGGFWSAAPLALGVVVGDAIWPLLAVLGVSWVVSEVSDFLVILKYVAMAMFLVMGIQLIRKRDVTINTNSGLTRPGMWAGFVAGVLVILGNPKAILFYMGILPGFFDLSMINRYDIAAIVLVSIIVPLVGNLLMAALLNVVRGLLQSPTALRRMNVVSGLMLIFVGMVIPFA